MKAKEDITPLASARAEYTARSVSIEKQDDSSAEQVAPETDGAVSADGSNSRAFEGNLSQLEVSQGAGPIRKAVSEVNAQIDSQMVAWLAQVPNQFLPTEQQTTEVWGAIEQRIAATQTAPWKGHSVRLVRQGRWWVYASGGALILGLALWATQHDGGASGNLGTAEHAEFASDRGSRPASASETADALNQELQPSSVPALSAVPSITGANVAQPSAAGPSKVTTEAPRTRLTPAHEKKERLSTRWRHQKNDVEQTRQVEVRGVSQQIASVSPALALSRESSRGSLFSAAPDRSTQARADNDSPEPDEAAMRRDLLRLQRATAALRSGRAEEALLTLNRDPVEVLKAEAVLLRAESLCRLGKRGEGQTLLAGVRASQTSLSAERACAIDND